MTLDPSKSEHHGIDPYSIVGIRIEGWFNDNPNTSMYDVGIYHHDCADDARKLFSTITEEDARVMAFELDWTQTPHCDVCQANIT